MHWQHQGLIYNANASSGWAQTTAMLPVVHDKNASEWRIFLASCDEQNIGRIGYIDVDKNDPARILRVASGPLLNIGAKSAFDDHGVVPISLLDEGNHLKLYYVGFHLRTDIPYTLFAGLAVSRDGGESFTRVQNDTILLPCAGQEHIRTAPFVMKENDIYRMWYLGGGTWREHDGKKLPEYQLFHLTSKDGIHWPGEGELSLPSTDPAVHGYGRPFIWKRGVTYAMLYSTRHTVNGYHLNYAESPDGIAWKPRDETLNFTPSGENWDNDIQCFGVLAKHAGRTFMFYNGNGYGKSGLGLAELKESKNFF